MGSHRVLPGAQFTVRFTYCSDEDPAEMTMVGLAVPPTNASEYKLPQDQPGRLVQYWTDEAYRWRLGQLGAWRDPVNPGHAWYRYSHYSDKWGRWEFLDADTPSDAHYPRVLHKRTGNISVEVTDTEVIWRMEGYEDEAKDAKPGAEDYRHALDVTEKEYFPVFGFGGCNNHEEQPSVEIVSSTGPTD